MEAILTPQVTISYNK